eukprot:1182088-Prorocentrum_minimum.AAC.2
MVAKQVALGDTKKRQVLGVLLHGDAAFSGLGNVPEVRASPGGQPVTQSVRRRSCDVVVSAPGRAVSTASKTSTTTLSKTSTTSKTSRTTEKRRMRRQPTVRSSGRLFAIILHRLMR